jgi:hypothetical protein
MRSFEGADRDVYTGSEDEHSHGTLALLSRISTVPLNKIIRPQNLAKFELCHFGFDNVISAPRAATRPSIRCCKRAGNNSDERKFTVARQRTCTSLQWNCI